MKLIPWAFFIFFATAQATEVASSCPVILKQMVEHHLIEDDNNLSEEAILELKNENLLNDNEIELLRTSAKLGALTKTAVIKNVFANYFIKYYQFSKAEQVERNWKMLSDSVQTKGFSAESLYQESLKIIVMMPTDFPLFTIGMADVIEQMMKKHGLTLAEYNQIAGIVNSNDPEIKNLLAITLTYALAFPQKSLVRDVAEIVKKKNISSSKNIFPDLFSFSKNKSGDQDKINVADWLKLTRDQIFDEQSEYRNLKQEEKIRELKKQLTDFFGRRSKFDLNSYSMFVKEFFKDRLVFSEQAKNNVNISRLLRQVHKKNLFYRPPDQGPYDLSRIYFTDYYITILISGLYKVEGVYSTNEIDEMRAFINHSYSVIPNIDDLDVGVKKDIAILIEQKLKSLQGL